jgi:hypothetical protein
MAIHTNGGSDREGGAFHNSPVQRRRIAPASFEKGSSDFYNSLCYIRAFLNARWKTS